MALDQLFGVGESSAGALIRKQRLHSGGKLKCFAAVIKHVENMYPVMEIVARSEKYIGLQQAAQAPPRLHNVFVSGGAHDGTLHEQPRVRVKPLRQMVGGRQHGDSIARMARNLFEGLYAG